MVAASSYAPAVAKRAWADVFTPPAGYSSAARGDEVTAEEILKGGINDDDWSFPVVISTPAIDRVGDSVIPEGCIYKNFAGSPILFFDHQNIKFPVGGFRSPHDGRLFFAIEPGRGIIGRVWMFKEENTKHYEVCKDLWHLVKAGLMNGVSVGFEPRGQVKSLPTGGNLYSQWELLEISLVAIPANPDCTVIRDYLDDSRRRGKTFHPLVLKSLTAMTKEHESHESEAKREHPHEFSAEGRREEADSGAAMADGSFPIKNEQDLKDALHDVGRAKDPAAARRHITERAHALGLSSHLPEDWHERGGVKEKSMSESSGTGGGYTVPEEKESSEKEPSEHEKTKESIASRMEDHKDGEHGGTHEAHFHAGSGAVHHVHGEEASPEHLKSVHEDLADISGVKEVHQSTEKPKDESGFEKVYPKDGEVHKNASDMDMEEESAKVAIEKAARKAEARAKRIAALVESGQHVQRMLKSGIFSWIVRKSTEDCVSRKIKYLHDSGEAEKHGWANDQIAAIAYHYCGQSKGLPVLVTKAAPPEKKEGDAAAAREEEEHELPEDEAAEGGRPGVLAFQTIIENLEAMLGNQEPEVGELLEEIIQLTRDHAEERYPEEDFGGEEHPDSAEDRSNEAEEQEKTNEELSRYRAKGGKPRRTKRYVAAVRLKALRRAVSEDHALALHRAASHMHDIGDMPATEIEHRGHQGMFIKGYTTKHHADCRVMGRKLDRLHGAIAKAEEVAEDEKLTHEEHQPGDKVETVEKGLDWNDPQLLSLLREYEQQRQVTDDKVSQLHLRATGRTA